MADPCVAIRSFLLGNTALSGLVGDRFTPDALPSGEVLPAIVYHRVSTVHGGDLRGSKSSLARIRVEFEVFAESRSEANEVSEAIRLSGVLDLIDVVHGVNFRSVQVDAGQRHSVDRPDDGGHEFRYVTSQDYAFSYEESV